MDVVHLLQHVVAKRTGSALNNNHDSSKVPVWLSSAKKWHSMERVKLVAPEHKVTEVTFRLLDNAFSAVCITGHNQTVRKATLCQHVCKNSAVPGTSLCQPLDPIKDLTVLNLSCISHRNSLYVGWHTGCLDQHNLSIPCGVESR